jgi:histidine triad (HIT) family protein
MDCPFCDMSGEQYRVLEQDDLTLVFLSNKRRVKGHILVVPKRHVEVPWELTEAEWVRIGQLLQRYQKLVVEKLDADGVDTDQRFRPWVEPFALGKQNHLHYHIVPRRAGDDIETQITAREKELWQELTDVEVNEVKRLLQ